jgi:hypothetical protein
MDWGFGLYPSMGYGTAGEETLEIGRAHVW